MNGYKHRQIGFAIIIFFAVIIGIIIISYLFIATKAFHLSTLISFIIVISIPVACLILFYSLNVVIENRKLTISFGIGLIKMDYNLSEIKQSKKVKCPWYYRIYNLKNTGAVEISLQNGKKYQIGSDEPNALESAINKGIKVKAVPRSEAKTALKLKPKTISKSKPKAKVKPKSKPKTKATTKAKAKAKPKKKK
jgi:hypothetical protein